MSEQIDKLIAESRELRSRASRLEQQAADIAAADFEAIETIVPVQQLELINDPVTRSVLVHANGIEFRILDGEVRGLGEMCKHRRMVLRIRLEAM